MGKTESALLRTVARIAADIPYLFVSCTLNTKSALNASNMLDGTLTLRLPCDDATASHAANAADAFTGCVAGALTSDHAAVKGVPKLPVEADASSDNESQTPICCGAVSDTWTVACAHNYARINITNLRIKYWSSRQTLNAPPHALAHPTQPVTHD